MLIWGGGGGGDTFVEEIICFVFLEPSFSLNVETENAATRLSDLARLYSTIKKITSTGHVTL